MSKYDQFEDFVLAVEKRADEKSQASHGHPLEELASSPIGMAKMVFGAPPQEWVSFILILLTPFAAMLAIMSMVLTPVELAVFALIAMYYGYGQMGDHYTGNVLPSIHNGIVHHFEERFDSHLNDAAYIERMIEEASDYMYGHAIRPVGLFFS